jgi:hypothetical protein
MNYLGVRAIEVSETKPLHFDKLNHHDTRAKKLGRVDTNCIENQCDIDKGGEHNVKFVEP